MRYYNGQDKPITAAFNMADYEAAEFGRGRDKKKRKSRSALKTAGMVAGGVAGVAALGLGARYGGAALAKRGYMRKGAKLRSQMGDEGLSMQARSKARQTFEGMADKKPLGARERAVRDIQIIQEGTKALRGKADQMMNDVKSRLNRPNRPGATGATDAPTSSQIVAGAKPGPLQQARQRAKQDVGKVQNFLSNLGRKAKQDIDRTRDEFNKRRKG